MDVPRRQRTRAIAPGSGRSATRAAHLPTG